MADFFCILPTWDQFEQYLTVQRGIKVHSCYKARHKYIYTYFTHKEFNLVNFRQMIHGLMVGNSGKPPLSAASINKYVSTGKQICDYMGLTFLDGFRRHPEEQKPVIVIPERTMRNIAECYINRIQRPRYHNFKFKCAIYTLIYCGLRAHELTDLIWEQYHGDHFQILHTKTKRPRLVPVPDKLQRLFAKLPKESPYIFGSRHGKLKQDSLNEVIQERCRKLGIKNRYSAKNFRSSFVTQSSIAGGEATLPKIAKIAGHSISTAYRYYTEYDLKTLKDALESSHPLLRNNQSIDVLKRTVLEIIKKMVDMTKYEISLEIRPKDQNSRKLHIS